MVLDSVIDPALSFNEMTRARPRGSRSSLQSFFAWCAGTSVCAWRPAGDPTGTLQATDRSERGARRRRRRAVDGRREPSSTTRCSAACMRGRTGPSWAMPRRGRGRQRRQVVAHGGPLQRRTARPTATTWLRGDRLPRPSRDANDRDVRLTRGHPQGVGPGLRPAAGLGRGVVRRLAGAADAHRRAGQPPPVHRRSSSWAPRGDPATPYSWAVDVSHELAHGVLLTVDGRRPRGVLLQRVRAGLRGDLPVSGVTPPAGTTCAS